MQTSKPYNRGHADALLAPCGEVSPWRIDDRGVWPAYSDYEEAKRLGLKSEQKLLSWKPVMVFQDDQNAPDCKDTPALPFPFDARDLAAFMLDGVGAFVADYYGDWEDGPETESLNDIDPSNNYARRAVTEAFTAYRLAIEKVGKYDMDALTRRDAAHTAYWKSSNDKALSKAFEDAQAEWDAAYQAWLTKMVRCLLEPQAAAPEPVAGSASSVPSNGLATAQIAVIFDGLPYTAEDWPKRASDINWLKPARVALGAAGGATSLWCPATLARLIHGRGRGAAKQKTLEALNKRFRSNPVLEPWRDAWNQHYEMFNDAD